VPSNFEVPNPILNSPYEEPREYWDVKPGAPPTVIGMPAAWSILNKVNDRDNELTRTVKREEAE